MKKVKVCCLLLIVSLFIQMFTPVAFASSPQIPQSEIIEESIDNSSNISSKVEHFNDSIFYYYLDDYIAYVSQIAPSGSLVFSYSLRDTNELFQSTTLNIDTIYSSLNVDKSTDSNFTSLNVAIINNLEMFNVSSSHNLTFQSQQQNITPSASPTTNTISSTIYSSLPAAITATFGSNYNGTHKGTSVKSYNGTSYTVTCKESQEYRSSTLYSRLCEIDEPLTSLVSWVIDYIGNLSGINMNTIMANIVSYVITDGIMRLSKIITIHIGIGERIQTRIVNVSNYSGTQYWAGWTRKMYFFTGDKGCVPSGIYHYSVKHSDYDNITGLMDIGFQNFIDSTLQ